MSGARNFGIARSTSPNESRSASSRNSKKSGGWRRCVARASAASEATTPTSFELDEPSLTAFSPIISCFWACNLRCQSCDPAAIFTMLARQQELNTQFHQLFDAIVLAFSLFAAHALRYYGTGWLNLPYSIDPFRNYQWLLVVIIPFGPIFLDLQGFYQSPFNKTVGKSFVQVVRSMFYLSILVSACVIFLRLPLTSRAVPLLFILIATALLLLKERIIVRRIRRRAALGQVRERVLLAGVPQDIAALEESLTPEEGVLLQVVDRIDI